MKKLILIVFSIFLIGMVSVNALGGIDVIAKKPTFLESLFGITPFAISPTKEGVLTYNFNPGDTVTFAVSHQVRQDCTNARAYVLIKSPSGKDFIAPKYLEPPNVKDNDLVSVFVKGYLTQETGTWTAGSEIECTDGGYNIQISDTTTVTFEVGTPEICQEGEIGNAYCEGSFVIQNKRVCPSGQIIALKKEVCSDKCEFGECVTCIPQYTSICDLTDNCGGVRNTDGTICGQNQVCKSGSCVTKEVIPPEGEICCKIPHFPEADKFEFLTPEQCEGKAGTKVSNDKCAEEPEPEPEPEKECGDYLICPKDKCFLNPHPLLDRCQKQYPLTKEEYAEIIEANDWDAMWDSICYNKNQCESRNGFTVTCERDPRLRPFLEDESGVIEFFKDIAEFIESDEKPTKYCKATPPEKECSIDEDCKSGEKCVDGECVSNAYCNLVSNLNLIRLDDSCTGGSIVLVVGIILIAILFGRRG